MANIQSTFRYIYAALNPIENEAVTRKSRGVEVFDSFLKIRKLFTSILPGSPMDDFSEAARTDRGVSEQPAGTIDGVALMLLD
jgi:hypothetical protein